MEWIKNMFSSNSTASFGRVGSLIALLSSIVWVSWVVYNKQAIPDLGGVSLFIGTLYGLSKAGETMTNIKGA